MTKDVLTVMWKEWRSLLGAREKRLQSLGSPLLMLAFFGAVWPWRAGDAWLAGAHPIGAAVFLPMLVTMMTAPDSFAGERERHTLPTLLSSRLPDGAILWGKILWNVALAWGMVLAVLVLGLVTANVAQAGGPVAFYEVRTLVAAVALGLLITLFCVGLSIPVSLRASTVQGAMHGLAALLLLPALAGVLVLLGLKEANPEWSFESWVARCDPDLVLGTCCAALAVVDLALLRWACRRFERSRLIAP